MGGFSLGNLGTAISGAVQGAINGFKDAFSNDGQAATGLGMSNSDSFGASDGVNGASIMGSQDGLNNAPAQMARDFASEAGSIFDTNNETSNESDKDKEVKSAITSSGYYTRIDYDGDGIWDMVKYTDTTGQTSSEEETEAGEE